MGNSLGNAASSYLPPIRTLFPDIPSYGTLRIVHSYHYTIEPPRRRFVCGMPKCRKAFTTFSNQKRHESTHDLGGSNYNTAPSRILESESPQIPQVSSMEGSAPLPPLRALLALNTDTHFLSSIAPRRFTRLWRSLISMVSLPC